MTGLLDRLDAAAAPSARRPRGGVTREAYGPLDVEARDTGRRVDERGRAAHRASTRRPTSWVADARHRTGRWLATGQPPRHGGRRRSRSTAPTGWWPRVEVADAARAGAGRLRPRPRCVVAFANEEGARGTDGMVGSRALRRCGGRPPSCAAPTTTGSPSRSGSPTPAATPPPLAAAAGTVDAIDAFVELHIEQGPVLDAGRPRRRRRHRHHRSAGRRHRHRRRANHAGTTPMALRHDALVAAAEVVLAVEALAARRRRARRHLRPRRGAGPNVRNVVPGEVVLSVELRDEDAAARRRAGPASERAWSPDRRRGAASTIARHVGPVRRAQSPPIPTVLDVVEQAASALGPTVALAAERRRPRRADPRPRRCRWG